MTIATVTESYRSGESRRLTIASRRKDRNSDGVLCRREQDGGKGGTAEQFQRLTKLGVKVNISEMDVALNGLPGNSPEDRLRVQADIYKEVLGACVDIKGFSGVTFWGFSDRSTWVNWLRFLTQNIIAACPVVFRSIPQPDFPTYSARSSEVLS